MGLEHGGAGAHDLTALASQVTPGTYLSEAPAWLRIVRRRHQCPLPSSLAGAVHIEDEQAVALMVNESTEELSRHAMRAEVVVELLAQRLQARLVDVGQEAAEGGAMGQLVASEERHERSSEWAQAIKEGLDSGLTAERIAEQDRDEVDDVVVAGATSAESDLLGNGIKDAALSEMADQQDQFSKPGWDRRNIGRAGVNLHERCGNSSHMQLLRRSRKLLHRSIVAEWLGGLRPQPQLVAHLVGTTHEMRNELRV